MENFRLKAGGMKAETTLDMFRKFWAGQNPGPLLSICHEPAYRQNPDLNRMVEMAVDCNLADEATGENVLPTFIPDFGTVSIPALWAVGGFPRPKAGEYISSRWRIRWAT